MKLPNAPLGYNTQNEQQTRSALEREDARNLKRDQNIDMSGVRFFMYSPDGTRWELTVTNLGVAVFVPA